LLLGFKGTPQAEPWRVDRVLRQADQQKAITTMPAAMISHRESNPIQSGRRYCRVARAPNSRSYHEALRVSRRAAIGDPSRMRRVQPQQPGHVGADHSFGLVDVLTLLFVIVYRYQQTREDGWRNGRLIA
jgi:hypothetical protein